MRRTIKGKRMVTLKTIVEEDMEEERK